MPRIGVGLGLGLRQAVAAAGGYDADAQAFFDRVTTAGGTLTTTEKNATNQLVLDIKSAGIWSAMKAVYPMVGASAAACAQNLKSSSFTGTFSSGWTFASTGVTGNGTSAYMDTNFNPVTQSQAQNSTYLSVYVRNNTGSGYDMGNSQDVGIGVKPTYIIARYLNNNAYIGIADVSYATSIASLDSMGFWSGGTNGSSAQIFYKNGTNIKTDTSTQSGFFSSNFYLGGVNGANLLQFPSNHQYAFSTISDGLSPTQNADFYTAVQAFQTTLSRQV
jgi:hypothetical protein